MNAMNDENGFIRVSCISDSFCTAKFCVTLIDSRGRIVCKQNTDRRGSATLPIACADNYRVRAQSRCGLSPKAQNRWVHLSSGENASIVFVFNKIQHHSHIGVPGSLEVTLRDAYYPKKTLSGGEIILWQTF